MKIPIPKKLATIGLVCFFFIGAGRLFSLTKAQSAVLIDSLQQALRASKADSNRVLLLCELGGKLASLDSSKALSYTHRALALSEQLGYVYGQGYSIHTLGYIYDCNYNFVQALTYYQQSLLLKEKIADTGGIAATLQNIGVLHYYQNDLERALDYYQKALEKRRQLGDSLGVASIYNNMAILYRRKKDYTTALNLYQEVLAIREQANDKKGLASTYSNLSTVHQFLSNFELALQLEEKAMALEKEEKNLKGVAHSLMSIGHIFYWKNDIETAAKKIRTAVYWADSAKAYEILARGYGSLSEIDSLQGNISLAYADYKKHIYYKELVFKEKEKEHIAVLQTIYETEKRERALEVSEKENELLLQKNKAQQQVIVFWIAISIAILGLVALLFNRNRIKQKNYRLLSEKNTQIANSLEEKELLLKEIHHRVKNNLQIISGLLHWQSQQSEDESLKKTVKEGKNRLKSMAMIHQRLYQEDSLKSIDIQDYINELLHELIASYGLSLDKLNIHTDIAPLHLDVDTMVPLGLILTELISNAIKHAFPTQFGEIRIAVKKDADKLEVVISDNGIGIEETSPHQAPEQSKHFGLRLVEMLSQKLDAQLNIYKNEGTTISLIINRFKIYPA